MGAELVVQRRDLWVRNQTGDPVIEIATDTDRLVRVIVGYTSAPTPGPIASGDGYVFTLRPSGLRGLDSLYLLGLVSPATLRTLLRLSVVWRHGSFADRISDEELGTPQKEQEIAHRVSQCDTRAMKERGSGVETGSWRRRRILALIPVLVVMIAGCSRSTSTSTNHNASNKHNESTNHNSEPVPTVTRITPPTGSTSGGTTVTITGTGFTGATKVTFGIVAATRYTVVSDTQITAVSPAEAPGIQNIHITTAGGTSEPVVAVDPFIYVTSVPTVTGVAPPTGSTAGGTTVTVTGTGFTGAAKVTFGAVAAASYVVVSDTQITAVSPAQAAGTRDIVVTTAGGTKTAVAAVDQFSYVVPVPTVTGVAPPTGSTSGGTTVTITGTGFTGATKVTFGILAATQLHGGLRHPDHRSFTSPSRRHPRHRRDHSGGDQVGSDGSRPVHLQGIKVRGPSDP